MHAFRAAKPARVAASLDHGHVHVWRLPHRPDQGRMPFQALVAHYLGVPFAAVGFRDDPRGRPAIAAPDGNLTVNWSHSGGHALLAIARSLPVLGVDYEVIRPRPRAMALAQRFFHPHEYADLLTLPAAEREAAFLKLWTAKEAVLKALGEGLRFGLHRIIFDVTGAHPAPTHFADAAGATGDWRLQRLDDAMGLACVAWRGEDRLVECFSCADDDLELCMRKPV
jgi:4'-phosphopantetheinyl transferase